VPRVDAVPIIAVCPYCREGKVRAPERAIGMSFPCPRCHSNFTLAPSDVPDPLARSSGGIAHPATRTAPVAVAETAPHPAAPAGRDEPGRPPDPDPTPEPAAAPPPVVRYVAPPAPATSNAPDPGLAWGLVALAVAGVGLAGSQLPYGRFITVGLGGVALLLALGGVLAADRKRLVPAAAAGVAALAVVLAVALPGWLGHSSWRPVEVEDRSGLVLSVGHNAGDRLPAEWVDAGKASWQRDDVRVTVRFATVGPIEVAGPKSQKKWTKEKVLQIGLRVANVGVARQFEFQGWSANAPAAAAPVLTDSAGKAVPAKKFDAGWEPAARPEHKPLFPGKTAEYLLVFEPPGKSAGDLRLELPAAAFGGEVPVKLRIPASFVGNR
jgi:hypothetical protein